MRRGRNTLNNMILDNMRKDRIYQAVITDLALTGNISKEDAETLLGYEIPEYLKSPAGDTISSWVDPDEDDKPVDDTSKVSSTDKED
jgi:hypothetical protein